MRFAFNDMNINWLETFASRKEYSLENAHMNTRFLLVTSAGALTLAACFLMGAAVRAGTPDAIYLFGDNSPSGDENGAAGIEVGQAAGADIPGFTIDHKGDPTLIVTTTFRDLAPRPDTAGQRPKYVNTAALSFPGTTLGSTTSGIGIQFDGANDHLRGPGLGFPENGDDNFTGPFASAYQQILTRIVEGWVRPTNLAAGERQDIVNDTYQFGIHITSTGRWGMNFGSTFAQVDHFDFESNVSVASTLDAHGWAHVEQRTFDNSSAALYVNGRLILLSPNGDPLYHNAGFSSAAGTDLDIVFGADLPGTGNFFTGQLDNFRLIVAGDNRGVTANGKNYGAVDLSVDNDYIAAHVVRGDANGDGVVNGNGTGPAATDDVTFFVNHFLNKHTFTDTAGFSRVMGDITSVTTQADFNGDGTTNLLDWYILRQEHVDSPAVANLDIAALIAARTVPEPSAVGLAAIAAAALGARRRRRGC
jgi:hypothetical protein